MKLDVWMQAHQLALYVHGVSYDFPSRENYELGRQLRRAAFSIPTNIAEGSAHPSRAQYAHYLTIAAGSASECNPLRKKSLNCLQGTPLSQRLPT